MAVHHCARILYVIRSVKLPVPVRYDPLSVSVSVSAESEIFTFGRPLN